MKSMWAFKSLAGQFATAQSPPLRGACIISMNFMVLILVNRAPILALSWSSRSRAPLLDNLFEEKGILETARPARRGMNHHSSSRAGFGRKPAAVGGGCRLQGATEVQPQSRRGFEAHRLRDFVDRFGAGFKTALSRDQTLVGEPLVRRCSGLTAEATREGPLGHHGAASQSFDAQILAQLSLRP